MKSKAKEKWILNCYKLSMPLVILLCLACFLAGFYGSTTLVTQNMLPQNGIGGVGGRRSLEIVEEEDQVIFEHGETGDDDISEMRYQVLSWHPRALLFPNFASKEKCEAIIKLAKSRLAPSSLALRKGETAENTKDTRTRYFSYVKARQNWLPWLGRAEDGKSYDGSSLSW